jgi:hypothetical protein
VKKNEKPRFYGQKKLLSQLLSSFSHMAACRSSSKNIGKMSLITVLNKNSPQAQTEWGLDVFGVHGKLVKYVVHLSEKKIEKNLLFFTQAAKTAIDQFLVSRNFRD